MNSSVATHGQSAPELVSRRIAELGDWRGEALDTVRRLIREADPDAVEEVKWGASRLGRTTASSPPAGRTRAS
jgi:hypothetical protein